LELLLDTQAFLWFNANDPRLGRAARELIADGRNRTLVSVIVAWEIAIKYSRGRMPELEEPPESYVVTRMERFGFEVLPIEMAHAFRVAHLPRHHGDPFDRLLVAQALVEGLPVVTGDANFARYGVEVVW
jgi:PIN domain nuclease of toxin-antitoxin system